MARKQLLMALSQREQRGEGDPGRQTALHNGAVKGDLVYWRKAKNVRALRFRRTLKISRWPKLIQSPPLRRAS